MHYSLAEANQFQNSQEQHNDIFLNPGRQPGQRRQGGMPQLLLEFGYFFRHRHCLLRQFPYFHPMFGHGAHKGRKQVVQRQGRQLPGTSCTGVQRRPAG